LAGASGGTRSTSDWSGGASSRQKLFPRHFCTSTIRRGSGTVGLPASQKVDRSEVTLVCPTTSEAAAFCLVLRKFRFENNSKPTPFAEMALRRYLHDSRDDQSPVVHQFL
ncbi:MAG: hypothetical protein KDC44_13720, partial [Phaeodactylibacter sp.]|nr:hypothetical protein [Phaeodactylibacter sp.]